LCYTVHMKELILLRGPSGSGKSTIARSLGGCHHETDNFYINGAGVYVFNAEMIAKAHAWNRQNVRIDMLCEYSPIVVSNTFITHWEMSAYLDMAAKELDYFVRLIRTPGPWDANVLFKRNKHGVPLSTIERQIAKYQPHEKDEEWKEISIFNS